MANIKKVTILDTTRIRLDQDAQEGDVIDLLDINQVDTQIITKRIDEAKDFEYQRRFENIKRHSKVKRKLRYMMLLKH